MSCSVLSILVAGGSGTRMGTAVPKQFLYLAGKPVLMHTISLFARVGRVVLVLPSSQVDYWNRLCIENGFDEPHEIAFGGDSRHASVSNGLALWRGEDLVAVHDGVRPLVSPDTIDRCLADALKFGSAIPVLPSIESVRMVDSSDGASHAVDRRDVMMVQTPQVFRSDIIRRAYELPFSPLFTDDASVVEASGVAVHLSQGNVGNVKLTTPEDMVFAEALLASRRNHA